MSTAGLLRPALLELQTPIDRRASAQARRLAGDEVLAAAGRLAGAPRVLRWDRTADRPPTAAGGWYGSLTNTSRLAAAVVAREPVGLDAEWCGRPRLAAARTRLRETGELDRLGRDGRRDVLALWTAKEAVLKRAGVGIAGFEAARLTEERGGRLHFSFDGEQLVVTVLEVVDHVLAVAVRAGAELRVRPVRADEPDWIEEAVA